MVLYITRLYFNAATVQISIHKSSTLELILEMLLILINECKVQNTCTEYRNELEKKLKSSNIKCIHAQLNHIILLQNT